MDKQTILGDLKKTFDTLDYWVSLNKENVLVSGHMSLNGLSLKQNILGLYC